MKSRYIPEELQAPLAHAMDLYAIDTTYRQVSFLANCAHETQGFTRLVESLNYSPQRLLAVWPRRFTPAEAVDFAHDDKRIAERVYGGRNGNGPEGSGDGWKYRGRGLLQLTGKANYRQIGTLNGEPYVDYPDMVATPVHGSLAAAAFWSMKGCNELADEGKWETVRRTINGGINGADDVLAWQARFLNEWR